MIETGCLMSRRLRRWQPTYWRRWWCLSHGHPQAEWAPVVMNWTEPAYVRSDGEIINGKEVLIRQYMCAKHDREI